MIPVGDCLTVDGPMLSDVGFAEVDDGLAMEDVHAIHFDAGDVVAPCVVAGVAGGTGAAGPHPILVVLDQINHRQIPQFGHVRSLEDLPLIARSVSVHRHCAVRAILQIFQRKCQSCTYRHLSSHDPAPSVKVSLL